MSGWNRRSLVVREGSPSRRIVLNLTDDTMDALGRLSELRGVARSEVVRDLIRNAADLEESWTT